MPTAQQTFDLIKQGAENKVLDLALEQLDASFATLKKIVPQLNFRISGIDLVQLTEKTITITGKSDFIIPNVQIEASFSIIGDKLDIFMVIKPGKFNRLSDLPGLLGKLLKPADLIVFENTGFVVTTSDRNSIKASSFPAYHNKEVELSKGFNLITFINLVKSAGMAAPLLKPLTTVIGDGPYLMSWNVQEKIDLDFKYALPESVDIEILGAKLFKVGSPKFIISPYPLKFSIRGKMELPLPPASVRLNGSFSYSQNGITGTFYLDDIPELPFPLGFKGIHLMNFNFLAGVNYLPPSVLIGVQGNFYIGKNKPQLPSSDPAGINIAELKSNEYAFVFAVEGTTVVPKLLSLYLEKVDLEIVLQALSDSAIKLPDFLNALSFHKVMFHWCSTPGGMEKPDGSWAFPVFGFSGIIRILGKDSFCLLKVEPAEGTTGKFLCDPLNIGGDLLKITGDSKGTPATYKGDIRVEPGGMELLFNSEGNPFLSADAAITVLGLTSVDVKGEVSNTGLNARIKANALGILKDDIRLLYRDTTFFETECQLAVRIADAKIELPLNLGSLKLDTQLNGDYFAQFDKDNFITKIKVEFEFLGLTFSLPQLNLNVRDLKKLPEELLKYIKENAEEIFDKLISNAWVWLEATIKKIIEFAGDKMQAIGDALANTFKKTLDEGAELMKKVGYKAKEVGEALSKGYKASAREIAVALKKAGYLAEEVGEVLKDVLNKTGEAAAKILKEAGYQAEEIGRTLKNVYGFASDKIADALKSIDETATSIAKVLKDVAGASAEEIGKTLQRLNHGGEQVARAFNDIGEEAKVAADVVRKLYGITDDATRTVLIAAGYPEKIIDEIIPKHIKIPHVKLPHVKHVKLPHVKHVKLPHVKHIKVPHVKAHIKHLKAPHLKKPW